MQTRNINCGRLPEFFQAQDGIFSMTRLLSFMAFWPCAWVTVNVDDANKIAAMGILIGAYVVQSGVNTVGNVLSQPKIPGEPAQVTINQPAVSNVTGAAS